MLKIFVTVLLITIVFSVKIAENASVPVLPIAVSNDMLRFDNVSGPGITDKLISFFTAYARQANSLFHAVPYQHAEYIKSCMDT